MYFRSLVFVKHVVHRGSYIRKGVLTEKGPHLLQTSTFTSSHLLHTRSAVSILHNKLCNRENERNSVETNYFPRNFPPHHLAPTWQTTCKRCVHLSAHHLADVKKDVEDEPLVAKYDESGKPISNWKRMKLMMKAYGYVIIPVHWIIAPVWFGVFYYAIKMGVDIGPTLLKIGVSEAHVNSLQTSGASNALMAYALYKLFTPLRYTVTVGATEMSVRYLRRHGYMKPSPPKEKTYRTSLQETVQGMKDKAQDVKEIAQDKAQDFKDKAQDKAQDFKDKAQDKAQDFKDKAQDKAQDFKDKVQDKAQDLKDQAQERKDKRKN